MIGGPWRDRGVAYDVAGNPADGPLNTLVRRP
jgi:hypothetical protein